MIMSLGVCGLCSFVKLSEYVLYLLYNFNIEKYSLISFKV